MHVGAAHLPHACTLVWLRRDLRLSDNAALRAALDGGGAVVPVYVWSPADDGAWPPGAASRWWLHHSLTQLDAALRKAGSRLIVRCGHAASVLPELAAECGATAVAWPRQYEPDARAVAMAARDALEQRGVTVIETRGNVLFEPGELLTTSGDAYRVFTPFWNAIRGMRGGVPPSLRAPTTIAAPARWPASRRIADLDLEPRVDWAGGLRERWHPGEAGGRTALRRFVAARLAPYERSRDIPGESGTSRLSPHLHFGEVSVRQAWHAAAAGPHGAAFRRQLAWREFACHLLYFFPATPMEPLREPFRAFPWISDPAALHAWQRGRTGYPLVDAGMRELWATGWMHNRVRMVVASFLVKHLLIRWQDGAAWFWDTLVDADLANNTLGWQWAAGCGADAAPYFRVFNPTLQGERFDPEGTYVRRWIPEIARLPTRYIHQPWAAPRAALAAAGIILGKTYPEPIVDHAAARERALRAFHSLQR